MRSLCALAALLLWPSIVLAEAKPGLLAVLELRNKLAQQDVDAGYLSDRVRAAVLADVPAMKVMTRENLLVLLEASGRRLEDCEGECEIDTGRRIGADYVVSGDILRFGTSIKVNLRLHETAGGSMLSGVVASGKTADELDANLAKAVAELMKPFGPAAAEPTVRGFVPPPALPIGPDTPRELLALREAALRADEPGAPHPDEVARAWEKLAEAAPPNPWAAAARSRAGYWRAFADRFTKLRQAMAMTELSAPNKQKMIDDFAGDFGAGVIEPLIESVEPRAARPEICSALSAKLPARRIAVRTVGPTGRDASADVEIDGRAAGKAPGEIAAPPCAETISFVVPGAPPSSLPLTPKTSEIATVIPDRSWSVGILGSGTYDLDGTAATSGGGAALFLLGEHVQARAGFRITGVEKVNTCIQPCSTNGEFEVPLAVGAVWWLGSAAPVPPSWRAALGLRVESGYVSGEMQLPTQQLKWSGAPIVPTASLIVAYKRAFFVEPSIGRNVAFLGSCTYRSGGSADCGALNRTRVAVSLGYGF